MKMWALTNNEYGILSTYVAASEQLQNNQDGGRGMNNMHEVPHLCMVNNFIKQFIIQLDNSLIIIIQ